MLAAMSFFSVNCGHAFFSLCFIVGHAFLSLRFIDQGIRHQASMRFRFECQWADVPFAFRQDTQSGVHRRVFASTWCRKILVNYNDAYWISHRRGVGRNRSITNQGFSLSHTLPLSLFFLSLSLSLPPSLFLSLSLSLALTLALALTLRDCEKLSVITLQRWASTPRPLTNY